MSPLFSQFIAESRELLQDIGLQLLALERSPDDRSRVDNLFRQVHTLKGNSGLFDLPTLSHLLHAAEDLMDCVRTGVVSFSPSVTDILLRSMDHVALCIEQLAEGITLDADSASLALVTALRALTETSGVQALTAESPSEYTLSNSDGLAAVPEPVRLEAYNVHCAGTPLHWITYQPAVDCFFKGEDPFYLVRQLPDLYWARALPDDYWPQGEDLDIYQCHLRFEMLSGASFAELSALFRYVPEQVHIEAVDVTRLMTLQGGGVVFPGEATGLGISEQRDALQELLAAQAVSLHVVDPTIAGNLHAIACTLKACCAAAGRVTLRDSLATALDESLGLVSTAPLQAWLLLHSQALLESIGEASAFTPEPSVEMPALQERTDTASVVPRTLRVDQERIDQLMDLIGEIIVAKNALPYLAKRAEDHYGARELSREIRTQYAVINRITEALQDTIMQVRMLPLSFIFQRFPRLVRDLSRKLGKDVELNLDGDDTEADKNIVEALADPLIHILRNSLDHGLETPDERRAAGKDTTGKLSIRAVQEGDQVLIDITDDGRGIDPQMIRKRAFEKGLMDEESLARMDDESVQKLIFAPGFSTAEQITELSGRGVGMDVVRNAIEKVNGTLTLDSQLGRGTRLRLALPLSLAVSRAMMVETDSQLFAVPLEQVAETVRISAKDVHDLKHQQTLVLRERIIPLMRLRDLLALPPSAPSDADGELAILVVRVNEELLGIIVEKFHGTTDILLKPLAGVLAGLKGYAGSALLGDGSVLMVLDIKELI